MCATNLPTRYDFRSRAGHAPLYAGGTRARICLLMSPSAYCALAMCGAMSSTVPSSVNDRSKKTNEGPVPLRLKPIARGRHSDCTASMHCMHRVPLPMHVSSTCRTLIYQLSRVRPRGAWKHRITRRRCRSKSSSYAVDTRSVSTSLSLLPMGAYSARKIAPPTIMTWLEVSQTTVRTNSSCLMYVRPSL